MSAHLTTIVLNGLVDGELTPEQLAIAQQHLKNCPTCTSKALDQTLLKAAVAKSGHKYAQPSDFGDRLRMRLSSEARNADSASLPVQPRLSRWTRGVAFAGWALAALLLLTGTIVLQRNVTGLSSASADRVALVSEIRDLHVASLAGSAPAQVISSDRHTVKPWFQGKIPFTFNLPEQLPADVTLDGANLIYLEGQPVAQLFYSIGRHRVSVFLRQHTGSKAAGVFPQERSGFYLSGFNTGELEAVAIGDVDPSRLSALVAIIEQVQTADHK